MAPIWGAPLKVIRFFRHQIGLHSTAAGCINVDIVQTQLWVWGVALMFASAKPNFPSSAATVHCSAPTLFGSVAVLNRRKQV